MPGGAVEPRVMQAALAALPEHGNTWLYAQLALRSLKQAVYAPKNEGHYGLALERYMHFTSPIRRYPDLNVHRAIKTVLARRSDGKAPKLPDADELHWLGEQCSVAERRAESAGWLVDAWLKCDYLKDRVGDTFAGTIATVTEFGLFIELEGYFVQGLLHISNLGADYFNFNSRAMALEGERNGRRFVMGDALDVVIQNIEPAQGKIDLRLVGGSATRDRGRRRRQ
jgi:ribonuclease R